MANVDQGLLTKIKNNLRISHSALDDDLSDTINACLTDLQVCGVKAPETDPLILNAVKLYCRKEFTDDTSKAAAYQERYDALKSSLMMTGEYNAEAEAKADE
jgi:hypothetical protein